MTATDRAGIPTGVRIDSVVVGGAVVDAPEAVRRRDEFFVQMEVGPMSTSPVGGAQHAVGIALMILAGVLLVVVFMACAVTGQWPADWVFVAVIAALLLWRMGRRLIRR